MFYSCCHSGHLLAAWANVFRARAHGVVVTWYHDVRSGRYVRHSGSVPDSVPSDLFMAACHVSLYRFQTRRLSAVLIYMVGNKGPHTLSLNLWSQSAHIGAFY